MLGANIQGAGRAVTALANGLARTLLIAAALYLPIPLALVGLTVAWYVARWQDRRAAVNAPGA